MKENERNVARRNENGVKAGVETSVMSSEKQSSKYENNENQ
jgi:hypothetical protein